MVYLFKTRRFDIDYDNRYNLSTVISDYVENFLLENELKFSDVIINVSVEAFNGLFGGKIVEATLTITYKKGKE